MQFNFYLNLNRFLFQSGKQLLAPERRTAQWNMDVTWLIDIKLRESIATFLIYFRSELRRFS